MCLLRTSITADNAASRELLEHYSPRPAELRLDPDGER